jgi:hypothetical protein
MNKKCFVPKIRSFFPPHSILIMAGLMLAFLLGACETTAPTPSAEPVIAEPVIYEVQTTSAENVSIQFTATPAPTSTPTPTPYVTLTAATPTPTPQSQYETYSASSNCNASEFVRDMTVPNGTLFLPGDTFIKSWKFKNVGLCDWEEDYLLVFAQGDNMDGDATYIDKTVAVNKNGDASVLLTAPDDEGTYSGYWQLADQSGNVFGDLAYVEIVVSENVTSTPTPSPTATYTSTSTPTVTPTPMYTPTATVVETATETPTPTPTYTPTPTEESTAEPTAEPTKTDAVLLGRGARFF